MEMNHETALDFCSKKQVLLKAKEERLTQVISGMVRYSFVCHSKFRLKI